MYSLPFDVISVANALFYVVPMFCTVDLAQWGVLPAKNTLFRLKNDTVKYVILHKIMIHYNATVNYKVIMLHHKFPSISKVSCLF